MYTLVVWNFPRDTTILELEDLFHRFGELWDIRFAKHRKYALVTYYYQESAQAALSSNELWLNGMTLLAKMGEWTVL